MATTLTPAQIVILRADIDANSGPGGDLEIFVNGGDNSSIHSYYNVNKSPDFWIFRSAVPARELSEVIDLQDMANITSADSDRVIKLFTIRQTNGGKFDGRNSRTRSAWSDVFSATAGDNSQQAIIALWRRLAKRAEFLFILNTGTGTNVDPDTTDFEGSISLDDVRAAVALP